MHTADINLKMTASVSILTLNMEIVNHYNINFSILVVAFISFPTYYV